jgi:hypothetical protein
MDEPPLIDDFQQADIHDRTHSLWLLSQNSFIVTTKLSSNFNDGNFHEGVSQAVFHSLNFKRLRQFRH